MYVHRICVKRIVDFDQTYSRHTLRTVYREAARGNSISSRNSSPVGCIKLLTVSPPYLILSSCSVNIRSSGFERSPT